MVPVPYTEVKIDLREIVDWESFHAVFKRAMGFPGFYGRTLDGWIDCMSSVDNPEDLLSSIHAPPGGVLVLALRASRDFKTRCPEIFSALLDAVAFVNFRCMEVGGAPLLCLSYFD